MANNANVPHEAEDGFDKVNPKKSEGVDGHFIEQNPAPEIGGVREESGERAMGVLSSEEAMARYRAIQAKVKEIFGVEYPGQVEGMLTDVRSVDSVFGKDVFGKSPDGKWEICLLKTPGGFKRGGKNKGPKGPNVSLKSLVNLETGESF